MFKQLHNMLVYKNIKRLIQFDDRQALTNIIDENNHLLKEPEKAHELIRHAAEKNSEIINLFLKYDPLIITDKGKQILASAIRSNKQNSVAVIFSKYFNDIPLTENDQYDLFASAFLRGNIEVIKELTKYLDVNARDDYKRMTPMHLLLSYNLIMMNARSLLEQNNIGEKTETIINLLIHAGSDLKIKDNSGNTPLDVAKMNIPVTINPSVAKIINLLEKHMQNSPHKNSNVGKKKRIVDHSLKMIIMASLNPETLKTMIENNKVTEIVDMGNFPGETIKFIPQLQEVKDAYEASSLMQIADKYIKGNNIYKALQTYKIAYIKNPFDPILVMSIASQQLKLGDYENVLNDMRSALRLAPEGYCELNRLKENLDYVEGVVMGSNGNG